MNQKNENEFLIRQLENYFEQNNIALPENFLIFKEKAKKTFLQTDIPNGEYWKGTNLKELFNKPYIISQSTEKNNQKIDISKIFQCELNDIKTHILFTYNGTLINSGLQDEIFTNGIIFSSIHRALKEFPYLVNDYIKFLQLSDYNWLTAINVALIPDGLFLFIPDNTICNVPFQLINITDSHESIFTQTLNLIVVGKNSKLIFLHCDDSLNDKLSLTNSANEIFINDNATVDFYRLQNKSYESTLLSTSIFHLGRQSKLQFLNIIFNAGTIRNEVIVNMSDREATADIMGLYLIDKNQKIDNTIFVNHYSCSCHSNQTFKGIIDESAKAMFTGKIYVDRNASQTNAYQSIRNLLLSNESTAFSRPFLEIYNDDVRCSHGSTTGYLDSESLFYLRQRGICEKNARLMLMFAFADEIIQKISLPALKSRTENMVNRRLRGELNPCELCLLHCSPDHIVPYQLENEYLINL